VELLVLGDMQEGPVTNGWALASQGQGCVSGQKQVVQMGQNHHSGSPRRPVLREARARTQ